MSWLAGSFPDEDFQWRLFDELQTCCPAPTHRSSSRHYERLVIADNEGWMLGTGGRGDAAGSMLVEVRQRSLDALGAAGGLRLVLGLLGRGLRPSRVDLVAVDASGGLRPRDLLAAWRQGAVSTRVRTGKLWEELDGRQALFVGSRSSERYARIYESAGVLRLETEAKGGRAGELGARLEDGRDPTDLWAAELRGAIDFPRLSAWAALFAE